jgi:flagellar basal body rod protein FlgG
MPYGLYISAEGAKAQTTRLETIAHSLANVDTVGFKQDLARLQARHAEAIQRGFDTSGSRSINDIGGGVQVRDTVTNFAPGNYEDTGRPLDMSISGEGFFVVLKDDQQFLTRAGNFQLDAQGRLTTEQGHAVLGRDGTPIVLDPQRPYNVSANGAIQQDGEARELAVFRPQSLGDLARAGENLFFPLAATSPVPANQGRVQSGTLERSGVKPIQMMTDMIAASRAFEANIHIIQNQDHMVGSLIGRVLSSR